MRETPEQKKTLNFAEWFTKVRQSACSRTVFVFCAVFPFFLADIIMRFGINFMTVSDAKYYVVPILFDICWVFGLTYLCYGVLPRLAGKILYTLLYLFFHILFLANYVYFCIFDEFMWIGNIRLAGESMDYLSEALSHFHGGVIALMALYLLFLVVTLAFWQRPVYRKWYPRCVLAVIPFLLVALLHEGVMADARYQKSQGAWEVWEKPPLVYQHFQDANKSLNMCGFYQFTMKGIYRELTKTETHTSGELQHCEEYFEAKRSLPPNQMTGILRGKNVVFVLMESMDDWMITEQYTPTLRYMMDNGINFTNHYMPHRGTGYTFNAEFAMNTGFYCPRGVSSTSVYVNHSFPYAMPAMFGEEGYRVSSFHFNGPEFYNRKSMHRRFGYEEYYWLMNYMSLETCVQDSQVPQNNAVYERMTQDKFFDFFISYSAHFPYDVEDNKLKGAKANYPELIDESLDEETKNMLLLAHDTDMFFANLAERLKADGLYENTVIIGVTDHYAYGMKNKEKLEQYTLEAGSSIMERVPFFIFCPSLEPVTVEKVTSAIDIVPTITNLFGMDSGYYMGSDAFDEAYPGFVYFSGGSWFDGNIFYQPSQNIRSYDEETQAYIMQMHETIQQMEQINDCVIESDYFK